MRSGIGAFLTITPSGYIGIGVLNPEFKLDIARLVICEHLML